eukprot:7236131-Prymnesium_polylepis.1
MLRSQASGAFFCAHPMELYGGSPLSFAACFGLASAVKDILLKDDCYPDRPEWKCMWSGFLPLHAVVATGNVQMYALLCDGEKFMTHAASHDIPTFEGEGRIWKSTMLGLQLATQMGNRLMFEHIMRKRLRVVWEWGPAI